MNKESTEISIIALTKYFDIPTRIIYLDQSNAGEQIVNHHDFPIASNERQSVINLIYRPGHFDLIYL